jgi:hypothetical protein
MEFGTETKRKSRNVKKTYFDADSDDWTHEEDEIIQEVLGTNTKRSWKVIQ